SAGRRVRLDAANMEALLGVLDETRVHVCSDGPAPDEAAATMVAAVPRVTDEATRLVDGPAVQAGGGTADESADAPTRVDPRPSEGSAQAAPTRVAAATSGRATHSDWSHPERWEQKQSGPVGVGTVLKDRFVLEELVGRGGMGSVYRARDMRRVEAQDRETDVAIKLINEEFQQHPDAMVALQREAKKSQTLAHPNIVTVYDFDRDGATVFVSMAFLRGQPLDKLIRSAAPGALPMKQALDIVHQLADGLAYAHKKGFAHSDFKPGNVFITEKGDARILDFGIARAAADVATVEGTSENDDTRFDPTTLGAITPAYASLEMLQREAPIPSDDVYALACVAHEMLTGKHPYLDDEGAKLPATEAAKRKFNAAPIRGLPRRYQRAIQHGLAFERADRYPNAGAFVNAIKAPARIRRSLAAVTVALAVVAGVSWWYSYEQSELAVSMADLAPALAPSRDLLRAGDKYLAAGKFAQAHKEYAQAWEDGRTMAGVSTDQVKDLKVLVDRRVDQVIGHFLAQSRRTDLDGFPLQVLRLNLESLQHSDLGTRDEDIKLALTRIDKKLADAE
ncbi:MAG: protein kinase, partial [Salinisphaera sp.]|nr:protein kinase [Salinisphaera sp.]